MLDRQRDDDAAEMLMLILMLLLIVVVVVVMVMMVMLLLLLLSVVLMDGVGCDGLDRTMMVRRTHTWHTSRPQRIPADVSLSRCPAILTQTCTTK